MSETESLPLYNGMIILNAIWKLITACCKKRVNCTLRVPYRQFFYYYYTLNAIIHRTTIVQNKILSIICSWLFFVQLIFIGLVREGVVR